MKLKRLLESETSSRKLITIDCYDGEDELEKFLKWWEFMGNIGHSAVIHCDVEQPSEMVKIYCDGDGADRVKSITIKRIPEE